MHSFMKYATRRSLFSRSDSPTYVFFRTTHLWYTNFIHVFLMVWVYIFVDLLSNSLVNTSLQNFLIFLHSLQNKPSDKSQLPPRTIAQWFILIYFLVQTRSIIDLLVEKHLFTNPSTLFDDLHSFCYRRMRFL